MKTGVEEIVGPGTVGANEKRRGFVKAVGASAALAAVAYAPGLAKPAWARRGVVKFGCSLPQSGNFEQVSRLYRAGYEFWSETVGHKIRVGDLELPVEWVFYDDEFNPDFQIAANTTINFRDGPSTATDILEGLPPATPLEYLDEDAPTDDPADGERWMRFETEEGLVGWVREIDVTEYEP